MINNKSNQDLQENPEGLHGWIFVDKPFGLSSHGVVARLRRLYGRKQKIGHGGTLDPLATGVLPIALGEGTKVVSHLVETKKTYQFQVTWGQARATDDAEGDVIAHSYHRPSFEAIQEVIPNFIGKIEQTPPIYSAIKIKGKRAYQLARAGQDFVMKSRHVTIYSLTLEKMNSIDTATFNVTCEKGTYVRSLARDIAQNLGTQGYISQLKRTQIGKFGEDRTISLERLENIGHNIRDTKYMFSIESVLDDIPAIRLSCELGCRILKGQAVDLSFIEQPIACQIMAKALALTTSGVPLAIVKLENGRLCPKRVFNLT